MGTPRRLPLVVTGATVALVLAGTVAASANAGREDRGFGFGDGDGPGRGLPRGMLGPLGDRFGLGTDGVVRSETIIDLGQAGFLTRRVDTGTVTGATDTELTYALETGESATVTADEDTEVLSVSEVAEDDDAGLFRRRMMALDEAALADIPADAEVVVWSEAGDDGKFVAQRVVVQPSDEATDEAASTDEIPAEGDPSASPEADV